VQIAQDTGADEAAKRVGQGAAGIKPGNSMAQLLGLVSFSMAESAAIPPASYTNSTYRISYLHNRPEVYTHINIIAPGKKGASTNPRKNLARTNPVKEVAAA
jgi:hypothetical protein